MSLAKYSTLKTVIIWTLSIWQYQVYDLLLQDRREFVMQVTKLMTVSKPQIFVSRYKSKGQINGARILYPEGIFRSDNQSN